MSVWAVSCSLNETVDQPKFWWIWISTTCWFCWSSNFQIQKHHKGFCPWTLCITSLKTWLEPNLHHSSPSKHLQHKSCTSSFPSNISLNSCVQFIIVWHWCGVSLFHVSDAIRQRYEVERVFFLSNSTDRICWRCGGSWLRRGCWMRTSVWTPRPPHSAQTPGKQRYSLVFCFRYVWLFYLYILGVSLPLLF